ncbi:tRNA uridine-5-carboxymethylaminomethyl(34) synthesis GTPase MnmE, partial [Planococcus sp. SIMBA_143]
LKEAELILYVLNNNEPLTDEDIEILDSMADQNVINIVNKLDLEPKLDVEDLQKRYPGMPVVRTSIINGTGVDDLEDRIASLFFEG